MPVCWNWQTRRTQNPLMATSCGFDPHHRHHGKARQTIWFGALFCTTPISHAYFYSYNAKNYLCLGLIPMLNKSSPLIVRLKLRLAPYKFCNLYRFLQRFYRIRLPCTKSGLLWHTILEYYATEGFMNLILSDRALPVPEVCRASSEFFDLSQMRIAHCLGCFGC